MTSPPDRLVKALWNVDTLERVGRVAEARGTLIRATGINARMGEVCELGDPHSRQVLTAEVVGIERGTAVLAPLGPLEGVAINAEVVSKGFRATVGAGDSLLGRTVDALGNAIDGKPSPLGLTPVPVYRDAPGAMTRTPARQPFHTGVRVLDAVLTIAEGQRIGIFAAAGVGKSTLLGMLCRSAADVNVIVLLGERACALREFIDDNLGTEALRKSIIVVATSDRPALERSRAAHVGTGHGCSSGRATLSAARLRLFTRCSSTTRRAIPSVKRCGPFWTVTFICHANWRRPITSPPSMSLPAPAVPCRGWPSPLSCAQRDCFASTSLSTRTALQRRFSTPPQSASCCSSLRISTPLSMRMSRRCSKC